MKMQNPDEDYVQDIVIALEAAHAMADRIGEDVCVLSDFRVVVLRLNEEPPLEIVRPRNYRRGSLD